MSEQRFDNFMKEYPKFYFLHKFIYNLADKYYC